MTEIQKESRQQSVDIAVDISSPLHPITDLYLTFSTDISAHIPYNDSGELSNTAVLLIPPSLHQYENPQRWPQVRKTAVTWLVCLTTFITAYTPGAYATGLPQYQSEWGVSTTAVYGGVTLFTVCFAVAPMFLASLSELTGRRPVFLAAGVVFVVSQLGSGLSSTFERLLLARAFAGISSSVFSAVVGGVISDIHASAIDRSAPMSIFTGASLCGSGFGPMISGIIAQNWSWQWIYHAQTISCGLVVAALFLFFPETRGSVLLTRKAKALNSWYDAVDTFLEASSKNSTAVDNPGIAAAAACWVRTGRVRWHVQEDKKRATLPLLMKTSLSRPIMLLLTESVVFCFSLWMSFAWAIPYMTFEAVPLFFSRAYGFTQQATGLCFLALSTAAIIGVIISKLQDFLMQGSPIRLSFQGRPEERLVVACGQSLLLPIGLFWLGSTTREQVPWIVPVLSIGCSTLGIFSINLAVFNYLADSYDGYASSALAAQAFMRNLFAAGLCLTVEPMLDKTGFLGTGCLLGSISLVLCSVPWILVMWGPRIRKRSRLIKS